MTRNSPTAPDRPGAETAWPDSKPWGLHRVMSRRAWWLTLGSMIAAAAAARWAILDEFLRENPIAEIPWIDGRHYWLWAGQIARGQWLGDTPFLSAPLYPYFLALIRLAGGGLQTTYVAQIVMHLLTAVIIAVAARRRFGPSAGLVAAGLFLLMTEPAIAATRILASTLQLFLAAAVWWAWSRISDQVYGRVEGVEPSDPDGHGLARRAGRVPALQMTLLAGALIGMFALAWPPAILLAPLFALHLALLTRRTGGLLQALLGFAAAALVIAPATLHNYAASREFIPISAHSGITLRQGNASASRGVYTYVEGISGARSQMHQDAARMFQSATGRTGGWREIDAFFRRQAVAWWMEDWQRAVGLFARKLRWFLTSWRYDDMMPLPLEREYRISDRAILAPLALPWMLGAAAAGLLAVAVRPARSLPEWVMLVLPLAVVIIFFYSPRYRLPVIPVACGLSAYAFLQFRRFWYPSGVAIALTLAPALLAYWNHRAGFDSFDPQRGEMAGMRMLFVNTLSRSYQQVGDAYLHRGDLPQAARRYHEALRVDPENRGAGRQLGVVSMKSGRLAEALQFLDRSFNAADRNSTAHFYNVQIQSGQPEMAVHTLRRGVEARPDDVELRLALAWMLATCEDAGIRNASEGLEHARRARDLTRRTPSRTGPADISLTGEVGPKPADAAIHPAVVLDVLAAAHAEAGDFIEALSTALSAVELARGSNDPALARDVESRLAAFRERRPVRAAPRLLTANDAPDFVPLD